ncbi:uncharacterized protein PV09_03527 [Verruconis gallopava]|uniref:Uncharacterized protein n=1 Tax=Verruconis gallopava TaxID=253628 RepID=A0A0D2AFC0_9PEZI|nr:uncharacterized protein PV09_03527 [Verruconis gallopava]KIW05663.1 hypothetical protein PV09_03527 [Verruconis gallopava]
MFRAERQRALASADCRDTQLWLLECCDAAQSAGTPTVRCEAWSSERLRAWPITLRSTGPDQPKVKIRLAACNAMLFGELRLHLSRGEYEVLEKELDLHPCTLPSIEVRYGALEQHVEYKDPTQPSRGLRKLYFVLKPTGKYEIFSHGLSCTYDFETGTTTGMLFGDGVTSTARCVEEPSLAFGILQDLQSHLEQCPDLWSDPLLVPTVFLGFHLRRVNAYVSRSLTEQIMRLEDELGVTRVGRRDSEQNVQAHKTFNRHRHEEDPEGPKGLLGKEKAMRLTIRVNTHLTRLLVAKQLPIWNCEASKAILHFVQEHGVYPRPTSPKVVAERLKANLHVATGLDRSLDSLQARLNLQLNVLYSFIAQTDNHHAAQLARLSVQLADMTSRDGASMKILALITTIFLPGTYVATLFSTSMFNWAAKDGEGLLSGHFWIYWAVAVPLTFVTISGWALWWRIETQRSRRARDDASHGASMIGR